MSQDEETRNGRSRAPEIVFIVEDAIEGGYTAYALGQSIVTEAETWDELQAMVRDAVHCHFDADEVPPVIRLHFIRGTEPFALERSGGSCAK
jgi:hypothetical protein